MSEHWTAVYFWTHAVSWYTQGMKGINFLLDKSIIKIQQ